MIELRISWNIPELRIVEELETDDEVEPRDETRSGTCDDTSEKTLELALEPGLVCWSFLSKIPTEAFFVLSISL